MDTYELTRRALPRLAPLTPADAMLACPGELSREARRTDGDDVGQGATKKAYQAPALAARPTIDRELVARLIVAVRLL